MRSENDSQYTASGDDPRRPDAGHAEATSSTGTSPPARPLLVTVSARYARDDLHAAATETPGRDRLIVARERHAAAAFERWRKSRAARDLDRDVTPATALALERMRRSA